MTQREIVLAALAPALGALHSPVQVQKLLFLIDREIPHLIDGPHFNFRPYHYGPFDKAVYIALDHLASDGAVEIVPQGNWHAFRLTPAGQTSGDGALARLHVSHPHAAAYIRKVSDFIRRRSFSALISAIYKAFPDMR